MENTDQYGRVGLQKASPDVMERQRQIAAEALGLKYEVLSASSDNVHMYRLGAVARAAGNPERGDVGDGIDRGLILLRLLNEAGYDVTSGRPLTKPAT